MTWQGVLHLPTVLGATLPILLSILGTRHWQPALWEMLRRRLAEAARVVVSPTAEQAKAAIINVWQTCYL